MGGNTDPRMDHTIAAINLTPARATNRWVIVVLLLLSVCINYIDRGSLSVAAPSCRRSSIYPRRSSGIYCPPFSGVTLCASS